VTINQVQVFSFAQEFGCILLCNYFSLRWKDWKLSGEWYQAFAGVNMLLINSRGILFGHTIHNVKFM
jgi:hypothetical protein